MTIPDTSSQAPTTTRTAIVYAAKSTADERGSITTQLADARELAQREGLTIEAEHSDENASAYKGNRGDHLAAALADCERLAAEHGTCTLIVQHSDRLARGDGKRAAHLVEYALWALKHDVRIRSVQDDQTFGDLLYAVVTGQRNHEDSARKSAAVRDGLRRRKESGAPVGPVPLGYTWEPVIGDDGKPIMRNDGKAVTQRVIDPATRPTVERVFQMLENGETFGAIARTFNAEGVTTRSGGTWVSRTVRKIAHNEAYCGGKGYPKIIEPERFRAVQDALTRLDPVARQRRAGGRASADEAYILRGILHCARCGSPLYTRRRSSMPDSARSYVCRERRQNTGRCDAPIIPAEQVEAHVLRHLNVFMDDVRDWLAEQVDNRDAEHQARLAKVQEQRAELADLDAQRERYAAEWRRMVDDGDKLARYALEEVERIDAERETRCIAIQEAEAVAAEWSAPPDLDAALEFYAGLVDLVTGRIDKARGARELRDHLSTVIAAMWAELADDGTLHATFRLRVPDGDNGHADLRLTDPGDEWAWVSETPDAEHSLSERFASPPPTSSAASLGVPIPPLVAAIGKGEA